MNELKDYELIGLDEVDDYENPNAIIHFKRLDGKAEWFVVAGDQQSNGDWLFFGIGDIICREMGMFTLSEIIKYEGVEDTDWTPVPLYDLI